MTLAEGFHAVAPGWLATVVTHLEMRSPPDRGSALDLPNGLTLRRVPSPDPGWYRALFRTVGADWLWTSRLAMAEAELGAILNDPAVKLWSLVQDGRDAGLLELDFRRAGECELAFLGVAPGLTGQGLGGVLMARALAEAWARPITRLHVHTCTHDHPSALGFYRRCGFVPLHQEIEILRDPRLSGLLPADAAPHVPIYRPAG